MKYGKWFRSTIIIGAIVLLMSGCSLIGLGDSQGSKQIDPPPVGSIEEVTANANDDHIPVEPQAVLQGMEERTIYAKDAYGLVAPVTLSLPKTEAPAQKVLEYMVAKGPASKQLPKGFTALLPAGTKVLGMSIVKDKLAIIDLSKELLQYDQADERKMLEGLTWALTTFDSIDQVQLRVEGKELTEMPKNRTPLDGALSRAMGINVEKQPEVSFGQSTSVTLYFMSGNETDYKYYVPVTRHIKQTDQVAEAVMDQLIKGPMSRQSLTSPINKSTQVLNLNPAEDLITVNLAGMLSENQKVSSEALNSVVLSLTENTGTSTKVQIMIDGNLKFTSTDSTNYSKPVTRPTHLNPVKM